MNNAYTHNQGIGNSQGVNFFTLKARPSHIQPARFPVVGTKVKITLVYAKSCYKIIFF